MIRISKSPHERKNEIIQTALKLFLTHGYDKTSVSMIVEQVGVAQGLFYYYFKSKEDVFESAMHFYTDHLANELIRELLCAKPLSLGERLSTVLIRISEMFAESDQVLMEGFSVRDRTEIDIQFSYHLSLMLIEPVCVLINLLAEQGHIRSDNTQSIASFIVFGIYGLIHGHHDISHNTDSLKPEILIPILSGTLGVSPEILMTEKITIPEDYFCENSYSI